MKRVGEQITLDEIEEGMWINAHFAEGYDISARVERIVRDQHGFYAAEGPGRRHIVGRSVEVTTTLAEDWPDLPRVEGLYMGTWKPRDSIGVRTRLGEWRPGTSDPAKWYFYPVGTSPWGGIGERRILELMKVTVVPDEALEQLAKRLADLTLDSFTDPPAPQEYDVLHAFFAIVNATEQG